jgi:hypothetical protein
MIALAAAPANLNAPKVPSLKVTPSMSSTRKNAPPARPALPSARWKLASPPDLFMNEKNQRDERWFFVA